MKDRNNLSLKNNEKNKINDLVSSINFKNKTDIIAFKNKNIIFKLLNNKIRGIINNKGSILNEDDEKIDENYFKFLPFELAINKKEINEILQTDIVLPYEKMKCKLKIENNFNKKNINKNQYSINIPKLNLLQIEFNKEIISYSDSAREKGYNDRKKNEKNINNNKKKIINIINLSNKNNQENIELKIKQLKKKIRFYKKRNSKMEIIINDFEKFQKKIKNKFIIYEKKMINKMEEHLKNNIEDINKRNNNSFIITMSKSF